jgi:hypothetical protein
MWRETDPSSLLSTLLVSQVDFSALKQSLELSERTDFINLRAENERLLGDISRLKQKLREEISRTQAGVRLDLNLEKGRIRDEMSVRETKMTEVDTRIENEIGLLRASMEAVKFKCVCFILSLSRTDAHFFSCAASSNTPSLSCPVPALSSSPTFACSSSSFSPAFPSLTVLLLQVRRMTSLHPPTRTSPPHPSFISSFRSCCIPPFALSCKSVLSSLALPFLLLSKVRFDKREERESAGYRICIAKSRCGKTKKQPNEKKTNEGKTTTTPTGGNAIKQDRNWGAT